MGHVGTDFLRRYRIGVGVLWLGRVSEGDSVDVIGFLIGCVVVTGR